MGLTQASRLLTPEEIAVQAGHQVPFLHLPKRASVFADRELRLRELSPAHPMRDYLLFMAELARAQHEVLQVYPAVTLPDTGALDSAARLGMPPLPATEWPRDRVWREQFRQLLDQMPKASERVMTLLHDRLLAND